jgi:hypothetical protein
MLELMALLGGLNGLGLSDRICCEFGVDLDDIRWLAELVELEALTRVQDTPEGSKNG